MTLEGKWRIDCVSIRYKGQEWQVMRPCARHHDVIAFIHAETGDTDIQGEEGFIATCYLYRRGLVGKFVDRAEAARIASAAGQIKEAKAELFSEDLW